MTANQDGGVARVTCVFSTHVTLPNLPHPASVLLALGGKKARGQHLQSLPGFSCSLRSVDTGHPAQVWITEALSGDQNKGLRWDPAQK